MGVVEEDIAAVKAATDLVGIVGQYTQGKQVGRRWVGLCPFHAEKSGSFSVNREDGLFHCLAGETRVVTGDGVVPIRELAGRTVRILSEEGRWIDAPFRSYGRQRLWEIEVRRDGQRKVLRATDGHRWFLAGDGRVERTTRQLVFGDVLAAVEARVPAGAPSAGSANWTVVRVTPTDAVEVVFCATVEPTHSFVLEDDILTGNCFGCQKSGDAITFVREIEHLDFVGAIEWLASRAGITLRYTSDDEGASRQKRKRLRDAMEKAVDWYHDRLLTGPDAGAARGYLRSRGFDGETVRTYRIGWAPSAWDELVRALKLPEDVLVATGLGFKNRSGKSTDAFRGRLLFPIYDAEGHAVAIGGRILPGGDPPKYKNSPETQLYSKSRVLYGLNWHKSAIVGHGAAGEVIVCEGYTDVIGFARAGIPRAVATCGTALTEDHVKLLGRFAKRIVLAFDADAAGQGAADKFAAWEQRYELEVCVADLPAGKDPGELAQEDPARLVASVERMAEWRPGASGAKPYLAFRLDRVLGAADLHSVEGRARAATAGVDVLRDHPNELVRDGYLRKLADYCQVDYTQLRSQLGQKPTPRSDQAARLTTPPVRPAARGPKHPAEVEALTLLVTRRDEMLPWLSEEVFADDRNLLVYLALAAEGGVTEALTWLHDNDPGAAEVLAEIAVADSAAEPSDVGILLLDFAGRRRLKELEAEARVAADPLALAPVIRDLRLALEALRDPHGAGDAPAAVLAALRSPTSPSDPGDAEPDGPVGH